MQKQKRQLISFDWALKRVLRGKANHRVLEGFLSELLGEDISIRSVLESESNREHAQDRGNRVDLLVSDSQDRRILIEVQYTREGDYFQRMLYGVSKAITESLSIGRRYGEITRVISVNIVYFDLGQGGDYVYTGGTEFRGLHDHDVLALSAEQRRLFLADAVTQLFPQYYILKVNNFNDVARSGLDEWIQFLKTGEIAFRCRARGLREAKAALDVLKLSAAEREAYESYIKEQRIAAGVAESTVLRAERAERELATATATLTAAVEAERRQKEEERCQKEEERHQKEEERRQKELLQAKLSLAVSALVAGGMTEADARRRLGLDPENGMNGGTTC